MAETQTKEMLHKLSDEIANIPTTSKPPIIPIIKARSVIDADQMLTHIREQQKAVNSLFQEHVDATFEYRKYCDEFMSRVQNILYQQMKRNDGGST